MPPRLVRFSGLLVVENVSGLLVVEKSLLQTTPPKY
jgi:hypothetical protein